jgi:hypothetical protein
VSWRGGRRAKGRRGGDHDPGADSSAWLAELEQAAAAADDEDDWADKLRGRRTGDLGPPPPRPPAPEPPRAPVDPPWSPSPAEPPWSAETAPPPARPVYEPPPTRPVYEPPPTRPAYEPPPPARPAPAPPPPARPAPAPRPAPDHRLLGMEPDDRRRQATDWDVDWGTQDPLARPAEEQPWSSWGDDQGGSSWWTPTPERSGEPRGPEGSGEPRGGAPAGRAPVDRAEPGDGWSGVEPSGREPDYPALFGELNRRHPPPDLDDQRWGRPDREVHPQPEIRPQPEVRPEPQQEPATNGWPFEDTTQSWEPSDRSFVWPSQELPPAASGWDSPSPSWLDEPWAPGAVPSEQRDTGQAGTGAQDDDLATRRWRPDDLVEAEPFGPVGVAPPAPQYAYAPEPVPTEAPGGGRAHPPEGRRVRQLDDRPRKSWPRVVAVISWIVLLMVVCWFYVFPWLERVLPENF